MARKAHYQLNDGGLTIIAVDALGPFNTWTSEPFENCLAVSSGGLVLQADGLVCKAGSTPEVALVLKGASWSTKVGDQGEVTEVVASGCNPTHWTCVKIE